MSLMLRATVANAAHDLVASWPLESFIAVNPLAAHESDPFDLVTEPGVRMTRSHSEYTTDRATGRITRADITAAIRERLPDVAQAEAISVSGTARTPSDLVAIDLELADWRHAALDRDSPSSALLDEITSVWLAAYLGNDAVWPMPRDSHDFYASWRALAIHDRMLSRSARRTLRSLPTRQADALHLALERLGVEADDTSTVLRRELEYLPGWVGYLAWRSDHRADIDLTSYLAMRFALRLALNEPPLMRGKRNHSGELDHGGERREATIYDRARRVVKKLGDDVADDDVLAVSKILAAHPLGEHAMTWQTAYEIHYRSALLTDICAPQAASGSPDIQVAMCIDPRSEGLRRHLEREQGIETLGFAGFFGVPIRFSHYKASGGVNSLPALLSPRHTVTEHPAHSRAAARRVGRLRVLEALRHAIHVTDSSAPSPFAFAELAGVFSGLAATVRTITPGAHGQISRIVSRLAVPRSATTVTVAAAFSLEERVAIAETSVRMMGIAEWAPLVVFTGHQSRSTNNLFESALDCGACGGNSGAVNARAAAAIFNDPDVRAALDRSGISIPPTTWFAAAEHETVTDSVTILDAHLLPTTHRSLATEFDDRTQRAAAGLTRERATSLPGATKRQSLRRMHARADDWAEVYPELGLANNAAMIIGPREMTRGVHLDRRVFLHSYRAQQDPTGTALEAIMTAPMIVAQWISCQYYFSALNPDALGAGTKTIHNAIGTVGVLSGHRGDLRRGLPWQSVGVGHTLLHEPQRLCVLVEAPLTRIGEIISRNKVLRHLFDNQWATLVARDDSASAWFRYTQFGWSAEPAPIGESKQ
jgi:uncharacterized protein